MTAGRNVNDGLCTPVIVIQARQLLATVCRLGGAECPMLDEARASDILDRVKHDPTVTIRLESNADELPHYSTLTDADYAATDPADVINRKRDLDVLQRLGLVPGATRRARYLYELLFKRIDTPDGICAFDTPGWEGCPLARSGAYESIHAKGWKAVVYDRTEDEKAEYRRRNADRIATDDRLFIRPHHLMCLSCWYAGGIGKTPRGNDTLYEVHQRIRKQPDVPLTLVEGPCEACDCCDGYHPETGRCVHGCGLVRDYKKDLDLFQKLGLMPGATLPAREVFRLIFERVGSTRDICGYGDGIVRAEEWRICGGPDGNSGYVKTRETGVF